VRNIANPGRIDRPNKAILEGAREISRLDSSRKLCPIRLDPGYTDPPSIHDTLTGLIHQRASTCTQARDRLLTSYIQAMDERSTTQLAELEWTEVF
jgi:hypothetical protein